MTHAKKFKGKLLEIHGLEAEELRVADAEDLPYPDNFFDLVYSWGVLNHTANIRQALAEIVRVVKPGGQGKIMVTHRFGLIAFYVWIRHALLKARPWKSLTWCIENHLQSKGSKAFLPGEVRQLLHGLPVSGLEIKPVITYSDLLKQHQNRFLTALASIPAYLLGWDRAGFYLLINFRKNQA